MNDSVIDTSRLPPHDLEAERALIGVCLCDTETLDLIESIVAPLHFYHPSNGLIFEVILALRLRKEPVDIVTICGELQRLERLSTVGGAQYIGTLTDTGTIAHAEGYARKIRDLWGVRETIKAAMEITAEGYAVSGDIGEYQNKAASRILATTDVAGDHDPVRLNVALEGSFEAIEKTLGQGRRITGLETGLRDMDTLTAGLHPGQLIVWAGRPAMGKTSLGLQAALHVALTTARPVLFFSLEMPTPELTNRLLCGGARVDQSRLRTNMLSGDDMAALTATAARIFAAPLYIDDYAGAGLRYIRSKARAKKRDDLALIVVDYVQIMAPPREGMDSREREVSETSRGLKALAKELKIPIIALAQLNRSPETRPGKNHRPQLSDLRESGALEQDADVVTFIYRDEVYNKDSDDKGIAELIVGKQRNGPTDTVRVRFLNSLTLFENLFNEDRPSEDVQRMTAAARASVPPPDSNYQERSESRDPDEPEHDF